MAPSISVAMALPNPVIRAQSTVDFPIGDPVNILSDYKETGPENIFNTITAVITHMLIKFR